MATIPNFKFTGPCFSFTLRPGLAKPISRGLIGAGVAGVGYGIYKFPIAIQRPGESMGSVMKRANSPEMQIRNKHSIAGLALGSSSILAGHALHKNKWAIDEHLSSLGTKLMRFRK